jgi:hypothetical protein
MNLHGYLNPKYQELHLHNDTLERKYKIKIYLKAMNDWEIQKNMYIIIEFGNDMSTDCNSGILHIIIDHWKKYTTADVDCLFHERCRIRLRKYNNSLDELVLKRMNVYEQYEGHTIIILDDYK